MNICYKLPQPKVNGNDGNDSYQYLTGKSALSEIMTHEVRKQHPRAKYNYEYIIDEPVFQMDHIGKYSMKIKNIMQSIMKSEGIVLIYSQFIDGALIPCALCLEEMGFKRAKHNNLFKFSPKRKRMNVLNMREEGNSNESGSSVFKQATYSIISGDIYHSPNVDEELKILTHPDNKNGEQCKVVLISQAGSEGIDFKNLRQVHILEPWYNLNRIEQIIGRAVRYCSHKHLPLAKRNCQIFLHGSTTSDMSSECVDLFIYRYAEKKAKKLEPYKKYLNQSASTAY